MSREHGKRKEEAGYIRLFFTIEGKGKALMANGRGNIPDLTSFSFFRKKTNPKRQKQWRASRHGPSASSHAACATRTNNKISFTAKNCSQKTLFYASTI